MHNIDDSLVVRPRSGFSLYWFCSDTAHKRQPMRQFLWNKIRVFLEYLNRVLNVVVLNALFWWYMLIYGACRLETPLKPQWLYWCRCFIAWLRWWTQYNKTFFSCRILHSGYKEYLTSLAQLAIRLQHLHQTVSSQPVFTLHAEIGNDTSLCAYSMCVGMWFVLIPGEKLQINYSSQKSCIIHLSAQ